VKIDTMKRWHEVAQAKDVEGLRQLLADDVVFHSPVVHTPQEGKAITAKYLEAAFNVLNNESFSYVRKMQDAENAILEFRLEIDGIVVNGVDMIHWNDEGLIDDFKVMIRPLKAINVIHQGMGAWLASN